MEEEIKVSICCIAYNHEKYIKEALEGFLMQKTNFKFEIIIHDDASTDNTAHIIKEYEEKYPNIIKGIYQTENQYQKMGHSLSVPLYKKAKGKYIAICEGDDYWIDKNKLQKQVDYLEAHPDCAMCFHNAWVLNEKTAKRRKFVPYNHRSKTYQRKDNTYTAGDMILIGFIPTASIIFKNIGTEKMEKMYKDAIAGDVILRTIPTSYGYAYYMEDIMSVYRTGNDTSVMATWRKENKDVKKNVMRNEKFISLYDKLDQETEFKYHNEFEKAKDIRKIENLVLERKRKEIKQQYKEEYKKIYSLKERGKIWIKCRTPKLYNEVKGRLKKNG